MINSPIDSKSAGQRNEHLILSMLRKHGRLSQSELCRLAGIRSSTASTIVARLREKGFVTERRGSSSKRGPKPILVELNPDYLYLIGIEINPSYLVLGLFNFVGFLKNKIRIPLGEDHSIGHVLTLLKDRLPDLLDDHRIDGSQIMGAGVTLSGSVTPDGNISLSSPMGWKNINLKEKLSAVLPFPVSVFSNRVRLLAEFEVQPELASRNILYINAANGVGSTLYMNGQLVFGASGRYGEIGHIIADPAGPLCGCGHQGCLEAIISGPALAAKIKQDIQHGTKTAFANSISHTPEELLADWPVHIERGDRYALQLREYVSRYISWAAAILINCYDPDIIILAGYVVLPFLPFLAQKIQQQIQTSVYDNALREIPIIPAQAGEDALIKGVAAAVIRQTHSPIW
ncbi:MAG TPA: ROK family transcriptional regulator [Anaerohalosphaeraceae bacterium]|nr:ROK family transcriptional regulator [Anaerohalosphaeraceae bacterium]HOL31756.1 ROK family transcriptional regulator [Anaerohalosphaeraceae bacterium]HOM74999.1 ROK family transcriptional regulator [Anaerohalosphaeraceae bacterium]HPC63250.1 ROK family transcriptional regulator [Anaerohalosphaeraceae bacterium]HRS72369.1 ROK family transcriptional regulator [Anaerohalosphaeraceae bacterium]